MAVIVPMVGRMVFHVRAGDHFSTLGLGSHFIRSRMLGSFVPRERAQHHDDAASNQLGRRVWVAIRSHFLDEFIDDFKAKLLVSHLSATEAEGSFYLHILAEKVDGVGNFDSEIIDVDLGTQLELLHLVGVLVLFGLLAFFRLLVTILAEIHYSANGRSRVRSDFDEVDTFGPGNGDGVGKREDAEWLAFEANHSNFAGSNLAVDSGKGTW